MAQRRRATRGRVLLGIDAVLHRHGKTEQRSRFRAGKTFVVAGPSSLEHLCRLESNECVERVRRLTPPEQPPGLPPPPPPSFPPLSDPLPPSQIAEADAR